MTVALATCRDLPNLDPDDAPLLGLLAECGVQAIPAVWDDPAVDWTSFSLVVLRSTWDYPNYADRFRAWLDTLPRVLNPPDVLRWNVDKRYLRDLARAEVPVVPTTFVSPGEPFAPPAFPFVVKPSVGVGTKDAARYAPGQDEAAREHVRRLHRDGRTAMVQPYLPRIEPEGETALVFLGGRYSHAIRKGAMLDGRPRAEGKLFVEEEVHPREPSPAQMAVADQALQVVPGGAEGLLYARVDLAPGDAGEPLLLELELMEPSLFLGTSAGSAARFADLIAAAARRG